MWQLAAVAFCVMPLLPELAILCSPGVPIALWCGSIQGVPHSGWCLPPLLGATE